ncbi:putative lipid II flippase FtsW [Candidatus Microgenomates bacterium]|nr:putative lipid II flippase FtsW [Candidatus Microgenomates bacterium]
MSRFSIRKPKIDIVLAMITIALVAFGLIMLSSVSAVNSFEHFGYNNFYLYRQMGFFAVGMVGWIFFQNLNYHYWKKIAKPFFLISLLLTFLVLVPGIGFNYNGASRWLNLGFFLFQPSELLKLALVVYLASWFDNMRSEIGSFRKVFVPFVILIGFIAAIILKQPDMGTFLVTGSVAVAIYFVAGARVIHIGFLLGGGIMGIIALIKAAPYRMARLLVFLDPEKDPLGAGFHINQALIAVGSGGWWGRGFGKSGQKYTGYIPEAPGDSIFAIIAEELGFVKLVFAPILLFIIFAWRGFHIARFAPDFFGKLLAFGLTSWIIFQAVLNISTMVALVPLTGVPLPFISYGGSAMITNLCAVGILLNISKNSNK